MLKAAEEVFYQKDYRSAKLADIACRANVPVGLIYSYFKNKAELFDAVVGSVYKSFFQAMEAEEALEEGNGLSRFEKVGNKYLYQLFENHNNFVILVDKSGGTSYENAKEEMIARLGKHITIGIARHTEKKYDPILAHILANNYTEGLIEIARHYRGRDWAVKMLNILNQCYYKGVLSL
ncbi:TetR family transcriptional regulator [Candidatus Fermentibacteria bacterium]|nr:MAG: TetR family transcriptional regulator [Candidatus Fermentibacteria bacterium]